MKRRRIKRNGPGALIGGLVGVAIVGVVGYFLYKKYASRLLDQSAPDPSTGSDASGAAAPQITQTIQHVAKGEKLATLEHEIITAKDPSMKYAKITGSTQDPAGNVVRKFTANADGYITGRLLQVKDNLFAEIRPG